MENESKIMDNSTEKKTEFNEFTAYELCDFQEEMMNHNWALRAFGALLESADLGHKFGGSWENNQEYRFGLNMIVEMYIEKQERELNEIGLKYRKSPEHCLKDAMRTYEEVRQGMFGCSNYALERVKTHLKKVNLLIAELGTEDYPQAEKIRDKLLELAGMISERLGGKAIPNVGKKDREVSNGEEKEGIMASQEAR